MLVEMMSIGTLLAYLCVSASVIVARYKPGDSNGHQILDEMPVDGQELNEMITTNGYHSTSKNNLNSEQSKKTVHQTDSNRSSNSSTNDASEFRSSENNQFIHWISQYDWLNRKWRSLQELKHELVTFKLKKYAPDTLPTICVFIMIGLMFILCSLGPHLVELSQDNGYWALVIFILAAALAITFAIIALHEQNITNLRYKVPCVPFIPTLSILFNVTMMTNLNKLTWLRLVLWMAVGFIIYFVYGIKNSTLNPGDYSI